MTSSYTEHFLLSHDSLKLFARDYPSPKTPDQAVLCLHGLTRNSRDFDSLQVQRVVVIGTSMGGMLAMMLAVAQRERVSGIVLNDTGPEIDPRGLERIKGYAGRLPKPKNWDDAIAQTRTVFGDALPNLSSERWSRITRRGYREDEKGALAVDADPLIGEVLRAAPPASANGLSGRR